MNVSSVISSYPSDYAQLIVERDPRKACIQVKLFNKDEIHFTNNALLLREIKKTALFKDLVVSEHPEHKNTSVISANLSHLFLSVLCSKVSSDTFIVPGLTLDHFLSDLVRMDKMTQGSKTDFSKKIKHDITLGEYLSSITTERNFKEAFRYANYMADNNQAATATTWLCTAKSFLKKEEKMSDHGCDLVSFFKTISTISNPTVLLDPEMRDAAAAASIRSIELSCDLTTPIVEELVNFLEKNNSVKKLVLRGMGFNPQPDFAEHIKKIAAALGKNTSIVELSLDQPEIEDGHVTSVLESIEKNEKSIIQEITFDGWKLTEQSANRLIETLENHSRITATIRSYKISDKLKNQVSSKNKQSADEERFKKKDEEEEKETKILKPREKFDPSIFNS
jgi:hypothetical protein